MKLLNCFRQAREKLEMFRELFGKTEKKGIKLGSWMGELYYNEYTEMANHTHGV